MRFRFILFCNEFSLLSLLDSSSQNRTINRTYESSSCSRSNDTIKALERMNLAVQRLSTTGNSTLIQEVKMFLEDAIQSLQQNLKLAEQLLGAQSEINAWLNSVDVAY